MTAEVPGFVAFYTRTVWSGILALLVKVLYNTFLTGDTMDIEWINETKCVVDYSVEAVAEYEAGLGDGIDKYTARFEAEFAVSEGKDIGGLIVYSENCVYDYENFCGWVR